MLKTKYFHTGNYPLLPIMGQRVFCLFMLIRNSIIKQLIAKNYFYGTLFIIPL